MSTLDKKETYLQWDKSDIGYGIEHFPEQVIGAWKVVQELTVPRAYKTVDRVVIVGMGGSNLGPQMVKDVFAGEMKVPLELVRGYNLPRYVNSKTLVILSSFSGTTEEVLAAAKEAKAMKARVMAISAGGPLVALAKREAWPHYQIDPGELARQPRLGLGFSLIGVMGLLRAAGLLKVSGKQIQAMMHAMSDVIDSCGIDIAASENPAKIVAEALRGKSVLIVAAEHLVGNAHALTNQVNETAKQLAFYSELPELNHHFLEGTVFPKGSFAGFAVLMLRSKLYGKRVQKRFDITADIFEAQGASVIDYDARGTTRLEEVAEVLQFGNFVSYYLGMLNEVDPQDIPFVDKFKSSLRGA